MKPLLKLFVAFCLVTFAFARPFPEGDEEEAAADDGGEKPEEDTTEASDGGEKPDDAAGEDDAGGDDAGGDDAEGGDAGGDDAEGDDAGGDDAGGDDAGGDDAEGGDAGGEDTGEGKEDGDDAEQEDEEGKEEGGGDDAGDDGAGGDEESSPKSGGGKGKGKDDRVNTYHKVVEQIDKGTKVDHIESTYLKPAMDNDLQAGLRNPVIDAISTIGDYSKIASCFKSMGSDVKKVLDQEIKSFKACMSKKDSSEYQCSEDSSSRARGKFTQIGSKIVSCVSSKGN